MPITECAVRKQNKTKNTKYGEYLNEKTLIAGWNVAESVGVAVSIRLPANGRGVVPGLYAMCSVVVVVFNVLRKCRS